MKATFASLSFALAMVGSGIGEEPATKAPGMTSAMAAVIANNKKYEEAYAESDVDALVGFFAEDADYTAEDGRNFIGCDALKSCLRDAFRINKGSKISINVDSVKPLTSDVVVEKGSTVVVSKTGDDRFFWESGNRTLNGDPQPAIGRIEIRRQKKGE